MKKLAYAAALILAIGVVYFWYGRPQAPEQRTEEPAPRLESVLESENALDESAPNVTFEHFLRTLSKPEQDCITQKIGPAGIEAWIANPDLEPTPEEAASLDACLQS